MGNACKISRNTNKEAIISVDELRVSIPIQRPPIDEKELNPLENLNVQQNNNLRSDAKTVSQKTNDTIPPKDNNQAEFEESAPKQFVEIQINHLKKHDSLKNEEASGNEVFIRIYFVYIYLPEKLKIGGF